MNIYICLYMNIYILFLWIFHLYSTISFNSTIQFNSTTRSGADDQNQQRTYAQHSAVVALRTRRAVAAESLSATKIVEMN